MTQTKMHAEIMEIPAAVERLLANGSGAIAAAANALRDLDPPYLLSVARGSSDHAATYVKYLSEILLGLPVASVGPAVSSVYKARLRVRGAAAIAISQSGKSPDLVDMAQMLRDQGATTIAITNNTQSPLGAASDHVLDIHAGAELSVAATKTFVTSAVTGALLVAEWAKDDALRGAIFDLPEVLSRAVQADWSPVVETVLAQPSLFCLGRGASFAISNEAALKFKETCQIHAESYSSAEVLHGPVSIVDQGFPVIALASNDASHDYIMSVAEDVAQKGATVFATSDRVGKSRLLPTVRGGHPLLDPISIICSFYKMVEQVSVRRGVNPDAPRHLRKVTETV